MSVASILQQMAENAGRARLQRGALIGGVVSDLSQVPGQIMADRDRQRLVARQQAQQDAQAGYARNADARATADQTRQDQGAAAAEKRQAVLQRGLAAGFADDPHTFNLDKGIASVVADGVPDLALTLRDVHAKFQPTITQQDPAKDTYENGVLVKPGVRPLKTTDNDLALLGMNANPVVAGMARGALALANKKQAGPGQVHDTANGLVRIGDDNSITPLGVKGYHPPPAAGAAPAGGLDPDAVAYTATQYRILGPQGIPTRIGESDKIHILNEAAKQAKALGQSPAQAVQKQAAYKSDASSLTKMTTMAASAEAFETKAIAQAELVRELSKKVGRTEWPIVNGVLLSGKAAVGDTDTHLFSNALLTFTTEYAKLMEGSTGSAAGSSEGARREAAKLISTALKKGTIEKTLDQMQWEMNQTREGYRATINHITERMGGAVPETVKPGAPIKVGGFTVVVKP